MMDREADGASSSLSEFAPGRRSFAQSNMTLLMMPSHACSEQALRFKPRAVHCCAKHKARVENGNKTSSTQGTLVVRLFYEQAPAGRCPASGRTPFALRANCEVFDGVPQPEHVS
ncbi:unnamed protein product [Effrenium voratum]|nr:unnamed protein product [Effrenium voratum]CAJ1461994.1 unnamed protein product [Effrenium voratum]